MCGIAGIISFEDDVSIEDLKMMTDKIVHRGPDGEGQWVNEGGKVGFGHRRLSIIDLSDHGKQPMHYADRYTITFNGEIYNYLEIRKELLSKGYTFKSDSDTEVLLALYDLDKERCLEKLDGMFAFAIWDEKEKKLFCARDRYGEKPFFYFKDKTKLAFASEIKALLPLIKQPRLNLLSAYNLLINNKIELPGDYSKNTFFEPIKKLEHNSYFIHFPYSADKKIKKGKVKLPEFDEKLDPTYFSTLQSIIKDSIYKRTRSDVPVGIGLSGGVDSSIIFSALSEIDKGINFKTFTARFDSEKDEGKIIDTCYTFLDAKNPRVNIWITENDLVDHLDKFLYHQEEPLKATHALSQFVLSKTVASHGVKVLLDGQGADEIFSGYSTFWIVYLSDLYKNNRKVFLEEINWLSKNPKNHKLIDVTKKYGFKFNAVLPHLYQRYSSMKTNLKTNSSVIGDIFLDEDLSRPQKQYFQNITYPSLKYNLNYVASKGGDLQELLRYADRNSMAHSVEVRLPFLGREVISIAKTLASNALIKDGWTKYCLRKAFEKSLPPEIIWNANKIGYESPQAKWLSHAKIVDLKNESFEYLKKNGIVKHQHSEDQWKHITLYKMIKNFNVSL